MKGTRTPSRPVQKSAWSRRCSKLALGKYEIQSKCKYRSARIPEGRAREKGNNGKVRSRAVLRRVRIFLHTFFPSLSFLSFRTTNRSKGALIVETNLRAEIFLWRRDESMDGGGYARGK